MIVENRRSNRMLLREVMKGLGCAIIEADDGAAAIFLLNSLDKPPDVLLTDIVMPNLDGITMIRLLRHLPEYDTMPVIVISALGNQTDIQAAIEAGGSFYLTKPLDTRLFLDRLTGFLDGA